MKRKKEHYEKVFGSRISSEEIIGMIFWRMFPDVAEEWMKMLMYILMLLLML